MKLLIAVIGLQLISESLQRLMGFSEIREKVLERKEFESPALQQSSCRTDTWSDFNFCANCTACNVTDYWGQRSLNVTCKPCDGYYYYSSDRNVRVSNQSTWGQPSVYQYRTDCYYGSDSECRWNATVTIDQYSYRGYSCQAIAQNTSQCWNKIDSDYWSGTCSNCTFCNSTSYNGSQLSNATCSPCNNYTWTNYYNRSVQSTTSTNYSALDNVQRYWYADCNNTWAPFTQCNWCYTCIRTNSAYGGWRCATCNSWSNSSGNSSNTTTNCITNSYSGYNQYTGRYLSANCSACNTTDSRGYVLNTSVNCWPGSSYSYQNNDYAVHSYNTTNYSSYDNIQRFFTSDCRNPYVSERENCAFSISCTKQPYRWFGFDCFFGDSNSSNTTNNTKTQEFYAWDTTRGMYLQSQCIFNSTYNGSTVLQSCRPLNYSWVTWNTSVNGDVWVYNSSSEDSFTRYFTTDCSGPSINDCYWVTGCSKSSWRSNGYDCWVFNGKANSSNSSNGTSRAYFENYDPYRGIWIEAKCDYTNSTYNRSVDCRPYGYSYSTGDDYVRTDSVYNSSSGDYDKLFYTDCGYSSSYYNCYWVTRCYNRSWNNSLFCTVSNYKGSNSSNTTNNTSQAFRYDLGYGNDWCANCTQNNNSSNSTSVSCKPCTTYTPYTSVRCTTQIHYFQNTYGGSSCANCTSCNTGFFNCAPCGFINLNAVQPEGVEAVQPQVLPFEQEFWENQ